MATSYPSQTSFNGGVQSPLLRGMVDAPSGHSSFQASKNMVPMKYGPIARRGGTEFVSESRAESGDGKRSELISFNYNDEQAYVLEFSSSVSNRMKVYKDKSVVLNSSPSVTQGITGIPAVSAGSDIVISVDGVGTNYPVGSEVVITGLTEATQLEGVISIVISRTASTVTVSNFPHLTAETSSTGTLSQIYELTIPYSASDMFASDGTFLLDVKQYNDVMYICHPNYQTRILTRAGDDDWSISIAEYKNGPTLPENTEKNNRFYLSPWRTEGSISGYKYATIESKTAEYGKEGVANNIFVPSDVQAVDDRGLTTLATDAGETWLGTSTQGGRIISIFVPQYITTPDGNPKDYRWHHLRIVKYISANEVWVERMDSDKDWSTRTDISYSRNWNGVDMRPNQWALGAFSDSTGYPSVTEIHDGRVILGKTTAEPDTLHFSASGGYSTTDFDFQTTDTDGQVYDDLGFNVNISGGDASPIQWVSSTSDGVAVGTYSSEGIIGANDRSKGFAPGNVSYRRNTSVGSKSIQPILIDQSTLFVSRTGRRLHELTYDITSTSQKSPDLTQIAEHVTKTGIIDFAFQREPRDTLWCVLTDGKLIGFTFDKNNEITAWHQHELGGDTTRVRSVACIPSSDGSEDEVWLSVDRKSYVTSGWYSDGNRRSVEVLTNVDNSDTSPISKRLLDCSKSLSETIVNCNFRANSGQGSIKDINASSGHPFAVDDIVFCKSVTLSSIDSSINTFPTDDFIRDTTLKDTLEGNYFRIQSEDTFEFDLKTMGGNYINIVDLVPTTYGDMQDIYDIEFQPVTTTLSGLSNYINERLYIFIDGQTYLNAKIPSTGTLTIPDSLYGSNIIVGYPYDSYVELQNLEAGDSRGITQGMIKKVNKVMVRVLNSLGLKYGPTEAELQEYEFDYDKDISEYRDLKSEDVILDWDEGYEQSGTLRFQGDGPYPLMIQSVTAEMETKGFSSNR